MTSHKDEVHSDGMGEWMTLVAAEGTNWSRKKHTHVEMQSFDTRAKY